MKMHKPLVQASVEVFLRVSSELLPTPSRPHYLFSMRDLARAVQGIMQIRSAHCGADVRSTLTRLWYHEQLRVYGDRLATASDSDWLEELLDEQVRVAFGVRGGVPGLLEGRDSVFGDFMRPGVPREERVYEEMRDMGRVTSLLEGSAEDFNLGTGRGALPGSSRQASVTARLSVTATESVSLSGRGKGMAASGLQVGALQMVFFRCVYVSVCLCVCARARVCAFAYAERSAVPD